MEPTRNDTTRRTACTLGGGGKAGVDTRMRPWPLGTSPGFSTGQRCRTGHEKGAGRVEIPAPRPSSQVVRERPTYSVISRTLSHLKSTSVALSQRKVAMGPPQVMGMASTAPPQCEASPPSWPESVTS